MTALLTITRAVLAAVVVVAGSLAVLWSVTGAPGLGTTDRLEEAAGAVCGAVLLLVALPPKPGPRRDGER